VATILVVDDEQPIRQLVARVLERKGYSVVACGTSTEALAVTTPIDLLLVDLVLPDLNGRQLTEKLRERMPLLPVILRSGYLPNPEMTPSPPSTFLQKPMMPAEVVKAVEDLLSAK